jgi:asparagine synthase (glutamine-hydrolysing)
VGSLAVLFSRSSRPDPECVKAMLRAAPHRGRELEVQVTGQTVLGVANDPDFRESWLASSNGAAAAFAGSLDNRAELNAELAEGGFRVEGDDPAATALVAFRAWGDKAPARLRGAFTGAFSDGLTVRTFRDHLGFRTLFYRDGPDAFLAATEPKQVVAGAGISREPDLEAVRDIFFGRLDDRTTALRGVERFPQASVAVATGAGTAAFQRYWDPRPVLESSRLSLPEARERLAELLDQAVARSVTGNDAITLSGGIDSPTVAAFAAPRHRELAGSPLLAVSAVYPDLPRVDERRYTELVADYVGASLHAYVPTAKPLDDLELWVDVLDGPWDTLSIPEVAEDFRLARSLGARTVLTGELGEYVYSMAQHLIGHLVLHGRWGAAARWATEVHAHGFRWRRIGRELARSLAPPRVATRYARVRKRDHRNLPPWIDPVEVGGIGHRYDLVRPARRRWSDAQLGAFWGAELTWEAADLCAGYCGVHVRRPLADVDLWEFVLSLQAETKFPDLVSKSLIRETMRGRLPDEILDRRDKTVFDDHVVSSADYHALRRWTLEAPDRLAGVDYALLKQRLERQELGPFELLWAYDLARAHAFLSRWR